MRASVYFLDTFFHSRCLSCLSLNYGLVLPSFVLCYHIRFECMTLDVVRYSCIQLSGFGFVLGIYCSCTTKTQCCLTVVLILLTIVFMFYTLCAINYKNLLGRVFVKPFLLLTLTSILLTTTFIFFVKSTPFLLFIGLYV